MVLNVTLDLGVPTVGNISKTIYLKLEHTGQALPIDVNMGKVIPITDEHLTHTSAHPDMFRRNPTAADVRRTSGGERASRRTRERVIGRAREHTRAMSREGMLRERDMGYRVFRARAREMRQAHDTPPADAETAQPGLELRVLAHSCVQVNSTDNANGPAVWTLTTFNSTSNGTGCRPNHWGYWANERLYRDVTNTTRDIFEKALEDATTDGTHENVQIVVTTVLYVRHTLDPEIQINAMDTELWMTAEEKDHVADKLHTLAVKCLAITCLFTVVIIMYRHRKKRQRRAYHGLQSQLVFEEQNAFSAGTQ
ncbi:hypothetical protein SARC_06997 [Sphaeroforma arctica JP610]|uniref:Uncharacterized protein n=1 Tax=Sphaeroforma arctica JP610 TaxID=667725 RepID=A0A0L0FVS7_9EUKA|nr:hypothetical protein SARC_06997 [Sphaeroforma arctica JP610]KNC80651.1 hypothetical protein SARC_06997 [Sphaeroforma arctica JP610]|eukprot:XP_014154553.1 hypothetical protein SARC_06997 [Sphaeroforma arctica JP610]